MVEAGVDVVEVGLPYSDPVMDGPVIQRAVDRALAAGTRPRRRAADRRGGGPDREPALVMTYWNPVEQYGVDRFAADLAAAGGAGMITPDLTPEEAGPWLAAADEHAAGPGLPGRAVVHGRAGGPDRRRCAAASSTRRR